MKALIKYVYRRQLSNKARSVFIIFLLTFLISVITIFSRGVLEYNHFLLIIDINSYGSDINSNDIIVLGLSEYQKKLLTENLYVKEVKSLESIKNNKELKENIVDLYNKVINSKNNNNDNNNFIPIKFIHIPKEHNLKANLTPYVIHFKNNVSIDKDLLVSSDNKTIGSFNFLDDNYLLKQHSSSYNQKFLQFINMLLLFILNINIIIFIFLLFFGVYKRDFLDIKNNLKVLMTLGCSIRKIKLMFYCEFFIYFIISTLLGNILGNIFSKYYINYSYNIINKISDKTLVPFTGRELLLNLIIYLVIFFIILFTIKLAVTKSINIIRYNSVEKRLKINTKKYFGQKIFGYNYFLAKRNIRTNRAMHFFVRYYLFQLLVFLLIMYFAHYELFKLTNSYLGRNILFDLLVKTLDIYICIHVILDIIYVITMSILKIIYSKNNFYKLKLQSFSDKALLKITLIENLLIYFKPLFLFSIIYLLIWLFSNRYEFFHFYINILFLYIVFFIINNIVAHLLLKLNKFSLNSDKF